MDQDINLIPEQDMVKDIDYETRQKICEKLDIGMILGNDCRGLAVKIGMSYKQVRIFWKGKGEGKVLSPTDEVLQTWQGRKDSTVRRLVEVVRGLERDDVVEVIMKRYRQGTTTVTGHVRTI